MADLQKLGRYELRRVLGKGAMGVVYEGFDPTLGRRVAVKTILRNAAIDEETERTYSERFAKEAKAVARLNHPNIVQVYDFGEEADVAYLVMEFIEGRELRSFFEAKEKFDTAEAVRIMGELLEALEFAHSAGVIHRDVKPANVMLDAERRVKLADFGVARVQDSDRSAAGTMVGTPAFMSPEQIQGHKIDRRTDIFSAGVVLYQLLTGDQPFTGEGAWTVARKIMQDEPPPPSSVVKSISPAFDAVVARALAKSAVQRFPSAKEFGAALRQALATPASVAAVSAQPSRATAAAAASEAEVEFWRAILNSDDPDEFEFYLKQFPEGTYAELARHKIAKLKPAAERAAAQAKAKREAEEAARQAAQEKARAEAAARERQEAEEKARRDAAARKEAQERARSEAQEKARREAAEKAAREKAAREAEEKAKREAEEREKARREAQERARREAEAKARREAEERARRAAQQAPATEPQPRAVQARRPLAVPLVLGGLVVVVAIAAFFVPGRKPAPPAEVKAPAPVEVSAAEVERIRKEAEERVRKEYADKSAAEQAAAAAAAAEKAVKDKQATHQAAADKAAQEKAQAEKAAAEKALAAAKSATERATAEKALAEKQAAEKALADKQAAEKAALEKAAAEKAAAEKAAAEKAAAEKAAAEKAAAQVAAEKALAEKAVAAKAAAAIRPGWPSVGDRWIYEVREVDGVGRRYSMTVDLQSVTGSQIRDALRTETGVRLEMIHSNSGVLAATGSGVASFWPYLRAFREIRSGESLPSFEQRNLWQCTAQLICTASARVAGQEKVTVRAGTFDAWKVVVQMTISGQQSRGGYGELTFWYSEQARRTVKFQSRVRYSAVGQTWNEPNVDMELVFYTPAK